MDSKRQLQSAELIKRNLSVVFQQEGSFIFGNALITVTDVKITPDLSQAKIYLSLYNVNDKNALLEKIINHTHVLKQALAQRIKSHIRRIPQIHFFMDETVDEMYRVDKLFDNIKTLYPEASQEEE
jgi:ribosome-binding factor A